MTNEEMFRVIFEDVCKYGQAVDRLENRVYRWRFGPDLLCEDMSTSPAGPFQTIFARNFIVYWWPLRHGATRVGHIDFRIGGPKELEFLARRFLLARQNQGK